jgi:eukaryotic translation initiation factor 2-alpha kinase 3
MSSMFRSPNDISSDPDPDSNDPDSIDDPSPAPLQLQESATESIEEHTGRLPPLMDEDMSWVQNLPPEAHRSIMTSSLLEFYYYQRAAEELNQQPGSEGCYTRYSPEAIAYGKRVFERQSKNMSSQGMMAPNLESEQFSLLRQNYRDGLDSSGRKALGDGDLAQEPPARALSPLFRSLHKSPLLSRSRSAMHRFLPARGMDEQTMPSIAQTIAEMEIATPMSEKHTNVANATPIFGSPPASFPLVTPSNTEARLFLSRYATEFTEMKLLGKGGYGKVYHVQNHVDGQHYAIKKIILTQKRFKKLQEGTIQELENILKEIRTLARLEHSNVVRYFGAWIERTLGNEVIPTSTPRRVLSPNRGLIQDSPGRISNDANVEAVFEEPEAGKRSSSTNVDINLEEAEDAQLEAEEDDDDEICLEDELGKVQEMSEHDDGVVFGEDTTSADEKLKVPETPDKRKSRDRRSSQATVGSAMSKKSTVHSTGADEEDEIEAIPREPGFLSRGQTTTVGGADEDIFTDGLGERETRLVAGEKRQEGPTVVLHIQMSLHPLSLATYLSPRPKATSSIPISRHCYHPVPSVRLMLAILGGVEYLHAKGIVHRDLKPGNIFLAESATPISPFNSINIHGCSSCDHEDKEPIYITPRIGDFGLVAEISGADPTPDAAQISSLTSPAKPVGTEFYRPPIRSVSVDEKLDVFALGVVMFELLWKFGTRMERHMVLANLGKGILPKDFADKAGSGGKALEKCISGMVRNDAGKRYGCAHVRKCLERILEEEAV